jgi:hypothetical protein
MSGYFDTLIQSYGPAADTPPAQMPWMTEVAASQDTSPDDAAAPGPALIQPKIGAVAEPAPVPLSPPQVASPALEQRDPIILDQSGPSAQPHAVDPVVAQKTETAAPDDAAMTVQELPASPAQVTVQHDMHETHLHQTETHLHQHEHSTQVITVTEFTPETLPAPQQDQPTALDAATDDMTATLAALEAHLARTLAGLHRPALDPAPPIITPADFEPDGSHLPPPVETETIREVTREIVREIHHHHDARPTAPQRPAPQSAAEASRIGPIRFASVWDRAG